MTNYLVKQRLLRARIIVGLWAKRIIFTKQGILGNSIIFGDTAAVRYNIYNQQKQLTNNNRLLIVHC